MPKRCDLLLIGDMIASIAKACSYVEHVSLESFAEQSEKVDAVTRNIEIIGEAAGRLTPEFRRAHSDVEWEKICSMRNRLVHGYFDVNLDVVWQTVKFDFPILQKRLLKFQLDAT